MIFLAGIGSEHEQTGKIMHPGDFTAQCRYAYRKLKKVLARNGATMADVVKQVTYVIDARHQQLAGKCRLRAYGKAPLPAHTFVNVSQLARPGNRCDRIGAPTRPLDGGWFLKCQVPCVRIPLTFCMSVGFFSKEVRFACPESGHLRSWLDCPLRVKSGHSIDEPLFSDQRPTRFGVEVVEELVTTGGQGPEADYAFAISRHNFFNP